MSLQVTKFLGYGLTDVAAQDLRVTDRRINPDSWVFTYSPPAPGSYLAWLEDRHGATGCSLDWAALIDVREGRDPRPGRDLLSAFAWSPEYGLPNVLAIQPWALNNWQRRDDPIDYMTETWLRPPGESQVNHVTVFRHGMYPWLGYMDERTGRRCDDAAIMPWIRLRNDHPDDPRNATTLDLMARAAGFRNHAEAEAHVVPVVPQDVQDLAAYAQLFTADDIWLQLRPLLYTYWS